MSDAQKSTAPTNLHCLICGGRELNVVWKITGRDVRTLWATTGRALHEDAFGVVTPEREVVQFECKSCGFRFFDPSLAGDGKFYEALESGGYYAERRPEFDFALAVCRREGFKSVLDVGGGAGAFLDQAHTAGLSTFAVELNVHAAEIAASKGHKVVRKFLENITPAEVGGGVDILTLFQVVEHVPDPVAFLRQAATLVRSGGMIVVAVPNNRGLHVVYPFDPANMPPHHISRWRLRDLQQLGSKCGLGIVAQGADILYGAGLAGFWLAHNRLAAAIGRVPHPGGEWLPKVLSFAYRILGCRHYFPRWGLSIYVAYRKP